MSVIKSYSVGNGDMCYIEHGSDNFTIIDCYLDDDTADDILPEIKGIEERKGITRFVSTHPDEDHFHGLELLDDEIGILNFYVVKNNVTKDDVTDSFERYRELRDNPKKAFSIEKGCKRRWMNVSNEDRKSSGIDILWPDRASAKFKEALEAAEEGDSPNNISAIIKYYLTSGVTALWMGDLETDFMETIEDELDLPKVNLLFAPHHGRESGRVPESLLKKMSPKMIVIGEAASEHLYYYDGYNTITQNSAGDIVFECEAGWVHVFTTEDYETDFLDNQEKTRDGYYYAGSLAVG